MPVEAREKIITDASPDFIRLPNHEYFPEAVPEPVINAFNDFSESAATLFHDNPNYPNARLLIAPEPGRIEQRVLDFIIAWGQATELPLPRKHMIAVYFGRAVLRKHHAKLYEKVALDAKGFAGAISLERSEDFPNLMITTIDQAGDPSHHKYILVSKEAGDLALVDTIANIHTGQPLRFHRSVRYWPSNSHIFAYHFPDDSYEKLRSQI